MHFLQPHHAGSAALAPAPIGAILCAGLGITASPEGVSSARWLIS